MRNKHTSGPENGLQKTAVSKQKCLAGAGDQKVTIDLIPRKGSQESEVRNQPSDLVERLRWWSRHHNWNDPNFVTNWLRIQLAFADMIRTAVNELAADGRDALALLIKTEFAELLETAQSLDRACVKRINAEYEMVKLEHIEEQLQQALVDLAAVLEGSQRPGELKPKERDAVAVLEKQRTGREIVDVAPVVSSKPLRPDGHLPLAGEELWITYAEAAKLLLVDKSTVSRLVERGILESNDRKGKWRRVSKGSVLIKKQQDDDERERRRDKGENNF